MDITGFCLLGCGMWNRPIIAKPVNVGTVMCPTCAFNFRRPQRVAQYQPAQVIEGNVVRKTLTLSVTSRILLL